MIDTKDVRGILTLVRNAVQEGPRPGPGPLDTTLPLAADTELRAGRFRQAADADGRQEKLNDFRLAMQKFPMIPALKETIAHCAGDPEWSRARPPLIEFTAEERKGLLAELEKRGFEMPGLAALAEI